MLAPIGARAATEGQLLTFTATATDPDGNTLTFSGGSLPTGATLSSAGVFSWTPTFAQAGNYTVTITVTDNGSPAASDFETFTITVGNVNRPPRAGRRSAPKTVNEGQSLTFTATATDPDGDALTFSGSRPAHRRDPDRGRRLQLDTELHSGRPLPTVTITVTDNGSPAPSDSETFTITVGNVNRPPVLAPIGAKTVNERAGAHVHGHRDRSGRKRADLHGQQPAHRRDPDARAAPSVGHRAPRRPATSACDHHRDRQREPAQNDSETFTITVGNVNRPPVLSPIGAKTVNEGQLLTFTATATDPDGGTLTFSGTNLPTGASLSPGRRLHLDAELHAGRQLPGDHHRKRRWADRLRRRFTITVGNVNRPPVLSPSPIGNRTVTVGRRCTIAITASDPDGDTLTFTSANLPSRCDPDAERQRRRHVQLDADDGPGQRPYTVTVTVSDGALTSAPEHLHHHGDAAAPRNRPPVLTNPGNKTVNEGQCCRSSHRERSGWQRAHLRRARPCRPARP